MNALAYLPLGKTAPKRGLSLQLTRSSRDAPDTFSCTVLAWRRPDLVVADMAHVAAALGKHQRPAPGALDRAFVAGGAGAEDVADFDQRRGEQGMDGEIRYGGGSIAFLVDIRTLLERQFPGPACPQTMCISSRFQAPSTKAWAPLVASLTRQFIL